MTLLRIEDLSVEFRTRAGTVAALDRVCLHVDRGETLGIVGESGSGKSVTAYAVMGLLPPAARVVSGQVLLDGEDLLRLPERRMRREVRGRRIGMVFQSPRTSLNPIRRVGDQIRDVLRAHGTPGRPEELLAQVGIPDPARRVRAYPFELSGGQCQRVGIAMALACRPDLLVADEPTTGLDVTTQAGIMELLAGLARDRGMACLFITHDLLLAAESCDRIAVMHAGQVVETAPAAALFGAPRHPYSARLLATTPRRHTGLAHLAPIPGGVPDLRGPLPDCRYAARCERVLPGCNVAVTTIHPAVAHALRCLNPL